MSKHVKKCRLVLTLFLLLAFASCNKSTLSIDPDLQSKVDSILQLNYVLFHCYHNGGNGIEKNLDNAFYHLEKAAEFNPDAYFQLALCYFNGDCTERDFQKAFEAFKTLADLTPSTHERYYDSVEQRNEQLSGFGEANYYVGLCFENGYGTNIQLNTAIYWYRKSAECGNEKAIKRLEELNC